MQLQRGLVWTAATLSLTFVFAGPRSIAEAQENPAKSSVTQDGRYYVYVNGLTWPTWLTNVVKQLRQVAGVRQVKVVDFKKGIFALTPKRGVRLSQTAIAAAVKRSGFSLSKVVAPNGRPSQEPPVAAIPPDAIDKLLATARKTFRNGDVNRAAKMADAIASKIPSLSTKSGKRAATGVSPRDADALQFLALVSFSQQNYDNAVKYARPALQGGSHWNWKALIGHYQKSAMYVSQLRELEKSIKEKPSAEKRFLIGYHYLILGYKDAARTQLALAAEKRPDDELIPQLLRTLKQGKSKWFHPFAWQ